MSRSLARADLPVISAQSLYSMIGDADPERDAHLGSADYSAIISGAAGSGKDGLMQSILDIDMKHGRTPIILDTKMEYPSVIFMQHDPVLAKKLRQRNLPPKSYKVNLWIPYTAGLETNDHFKKLLRCAHPRLRIRPFRILSSTLESPDTKTWMLGLSESQSLAESSESVKEKLTGSSKKWSEFKGEVSQKVLIMDDHNLHNNPDKPWLDGWEYVNFEDMTHGRTVNVISLFFMMKGNILVGLSTAIGLFNELLTRAMSPRKNTFAIYIPEMQILQPRGVKQVENQVKALQARILFGFLLMRSFHARVRLNLQNLSSLDKNLYSQSRIFVGRTINPSDLKLLRSDFRIPERDMTHLMSAKVGNFYDLKQRSFFTTIPQAHKSQAQQDFLKLYMTFRYNPENFLFNYYDTHVSDVLPSFWRESTLDVASYRVIAKKYFRNLQKSRNGIMLKQPAWKKASIEKATRALQKKIDANIKTFTDIGA